MGCINTRSLQAAPPEEQIELTPDQFPKQAKTLDQVFDMKGRIIVGKVVKVYDGDTITCIVNNMNQWIKYTIRLSDIDTCEMKINTKNMNNREIIDAGRSIICSKMAKARLIELITNGRIKYDIHNNDKAYPKLIDEMINDMDVFVKIKIEKYESKFGRQLGRIYGVDDTEYLVSYNQILLDEHHAYRYNGGTKLTILQQLQIVDPICNAH